MDPLRRQVNLAYTYLQFRQQNKTLTVAAQAAACHHRELTGQKDSRHAFPLVKKNVYGLGISDLCH